MTFSIAVSLCSNRSRTAASVLDLCSFWLWLFNFLPNMMCCSCVTIDIFESNVVYLSKLFLSTHFLSIMKKPSGGASLFFLFPMIHYYLILTEGSLCIQLPVHASRVPTGSTSPIQPFSGCIFRFLCHRVQLIWSHMCFNLTKQHCLTFNSHPWNP